jgi:LPXTG-motif cell wall-anchored protein
MKRFVASVAALAVLVVAPIASANGHETAISINCDAVTFSYSLFSDTRTTVSEETVVVNGTTVATKTFTFVGSGTDVIPLNISGDADVDASLSWTVVGGQRTGSKSASAHVQCGETTTGGTTTGGTTTGGTTTTGGGTTGGGTTGSGGVIGSTTGGTTGGNAETGGELPFTGLPVWIPALLALALLASGGFLLRRKRDDVS